MSLFNPAARARILADHVRAIYNLFKGVAGGEDAIVLANGTTVNMSAVDQNGFRVPAGPGAAPSTDGAVAYDTTAKVLKSGDGSTAKRYVTYPVPNADLDADLSRPNLLPNPGPNIWQRGAGAFAVSNAWTADRWQMVISGGTMSVEKTTGALLANMAKVDNASALGTLNILKLPVELAMKDVAGKEFALLVTAYVPAGCKCEARIYDGVAGVASAVVDGDDQYHEITVTGTMAANPTELGAYLYVQGTGTFYLGGVWLGFGSVAPSYQALPPREEWDRCQRYYEVHGGVANGPPAMYGTGGVGTTEVVNVSFLARKAVAPTMVKAGTWTVSNCSQPAISGNPTMAEFGLATTCTAAGQYVAVPAGNTCWVSAEANP